MLVGALKCIRRVRTVVVSYTECLPTIYRMSAELYYKLRYPHHADRWQQPRRFEGIIFSRSIIIVNVSCGPSISGWRVSPVQSSCCWIVGKLHRQVILKSIALLYTVVLNHTQPYFLSSQTRVIYTKYRPLYMLLYSYVWYMPDTRYQHTSMYVLLTAFGSHSGWRARQWPYAQFRVIVTAVYTLANST